MTNLKIYTKSKNKFMTIKTLLLVVIAAVLSVIVIIHSEFASKGIKHGIDYCTGVLIPSMFFLVFISTAIIKSEICNKTKIIFDKVTKFLFYLPGTTAPTILLSFIAGYPVSAAGIRELYRKNEINSEQLNRMMLFCVNLGPAFIISTLGKSMLKNTKTGLILFIIQITSSMLIGIISGIIARIKKTEFYYKNSDFKSVNFSFGSLLVESCEGTCKTLINMCTPVILFFGIVSIFENLNTIDYLAENLVRLGLDHGTATSLVVSLLEMTQGCMIAASHKTPLWVFSFALSFGGFCAHTQVISELKNTPFKYSKFLLCRLIVAVTQTIIFF